MQNLQDDKCLVSVNRDVLFLAKRLFTVVSQPNMISHISMESQVLLWIPHIFSVPSSEQGDWISLAPLSLFGKSLGEKIEIFPIMCQHKLDDVKVNTK